MKIYEALAGLNVPVCHPPYKGDSETYVTYQLLGQTGQIYAEGSEAETAMSYAVSVFSDTANLTLAQEVKAALEAAGYVATIDMETYNAETGRVQVAIVAETEGAVYG